MWPVSKRNETKRLLGREAARTKQNTQRAMTLGACLDDWIWSSLIPIICQFRHVVPRNPVPPSRQPDLAAVFVVVVVVEDHYYGSFGRHRRRRDCFQATRKTRMQILLLLLLSSCHVMSCHDVGGGGEIWRSVVLLCYSDGA
jgi:hypothetical protein